METWVGGGGGGKGGGGQQMQPYLVRVIGRPGPGVSYKLHAKPVM